jgi:hypothetical protein
MSDNVVNLNKARNARERAAREAQSAANRARFGQTAGEKAKGMTLAQKVKQVLDAAKRDPKA